MTHNRDWKIVGPALTAVFLLGLHSIALAAGRPPTPTDVTTYHYDNQRTGWNSNERTLTPANIRSLGLRATVVPLDDQVDAQPLIVTNQLIKGKGIHNVVYVATEGNTIYAIDADTSEILLSPGPERFGYPVPRPLGCNNNTAHVGINSTPVIDLAAGTMYVVVYRIEFGWPAYRLHALRLDDLTDKIPPAEIKASNTVSDGTTVYFNPQVQRQRAALLAANGNIYAAFTSFCDFKDDLSRGWLVGWKAGSLTPLPRTELTDTQSRSQFHNSFLSTIWMSGYGVAGDSSSDLYFVTGNSDGVRANNLQESAVKLSPDLTVVDYFTPFNFKELDVGNPGDQDFGSGGLLVLPDQPGQTPHLAVAAGKDGRMFVMDRDSMGGFVSGGPDKPQFVDIGSCFCGQSYFEGSDGVGRIVTSGGSKVQVYKVLPTGVGKGKPAPVALEGSSWYYISGDNHGFFTVVSSNGTQANTAIVWAVSPPTSGDPQRYVSLWAFGAAPSNGTLPLLYSATAGTWPEKNAKANIVPVVANDKVYVASYKQLAIFSLKPPCLVCDASAGGAGMTQERLLETPAAPAPPTFSGSVVYGTIVSINGEWLVLQLRTSRLLQVDLTDALKEHLTVIPYVGGGVLVRGILDSRGTLHGQVMLRAEDSASWDPDQLKPREDRD